MNKKFAELKNKTKEELQKALREKKEALRSFYFGSTGAKSTNVRAGRNLRREIARILTALGRE